MSDVPRTLGGHDAAEVVSALQKCIRRGLDEDDRLRVHASTTSKFRFFVEGKDGNDDI